MSAEKIFNKLDLQKLVRENATSVPLDFKNEYGDHLAISANVYVFASQGLWKFVESIIEHTHEQTLENIKDAIKEKNSV
jgi:hypothetical protein